MILAQAFARFAFDLDGVVWRGDQAIPGAPETIRALRDAGKRVCFVTNNSSETAQTYAERLEAVGAGGTAEDVVTSADATARLLERSVPGMRGRLVYVVGGAGLREAVQRLGGRLAETEEATDASVVVVGWDRGLTYERLKAAALAIRAGATFVASNTDATFPGPDGLWPGAGALVAALRTATDVEPLVAGKPDPMVLEVAKERLGGGPALAVGDRIETDIAAAHAAGWPAALVLTGAHGIPDLAAAPIWPDFVISGLPDLLEDRPHPEVRPAAGPDLPHIASMLHAGGLRSGPARERIGRTVVADVDRVPIATAAWEPVGQDALIRSVAVDQTLRRRGVGRLVVAGALRKAIEAGARTAYLATDDAGAFFDACGFARLEREDAPAAIRDHQMISRDCPTAALMRLALPAQANGG